VQQQGARGHLPFQPEQAGSYWDRNTQVEVVALNWRERSALLGEARWTTRPVSSQTLDELRSKAAAVLPEPDWHCHYALFARSGFTEALQQEAERAGILLVGLDTLIGESAEA
jgi:hypothetical protein